MMTDPSSITSVTEEDSDESDTTETSYSKASLSSVIYSSECNTDDKLTSSLVNISISKTNASSSPSKKRPRKYAQKHFSENDCNKSATTSDPFPYGCNPLPLNWKRQKVTQAKKKQKSFHSNALTRYVLQKRMGHQVQSSLPKQEEENFGIDDPNNYLYTDFSDTSSIPPNGDDDFDSINDDDSQFHNSNRTDNRPILPDMNSNVWFQARCFDTYWSNYHFVMEWYRQHMQAVGVLSSQLQWLHTGNWSQAQQTDRPKPKKKSKRRNPKTRARKRRLVKAKQKAAQAKLLEEQTINESGTAQDSDSVSDEDGLEMEITEEMMDFFTTSFKHRMERDKGKKNEDGECKGKEDEENKGNSSSAPFKIPSLNAPTEQPGVRRSAEMKTLYGVGAPMIHGMETALQMTHDKVLDRHKPKLWPNMPLKIVFA